MKTLITLLVGFYLIINTAQADMFLGGDVEAGIWFPNYSDQKQIGTKDVTGSGQSLFGSVTLEHPIPLIPNVKASFSTVDNDRYQYTKLDYSLYYEIFDNDTLSIDIGLGASQYMNGEYLKQSFSGILPHLYADVEVGLPFTGATLYSDVHYLNIADNKTLDAMAGLRYDVKLGLADLGVKAGYRLQTIDLDDFDQLSLNLKTEGFFTGLHLDF